ncbi:MAG: YkgJ family cysteine cluster protein [Desulfovibrionales bacterium]
MTKKAFVCNRCGHCCLGEGGIIVSPDEEERIRLFLQVSLQEFRERFTIRQNGKISLCSQENGYCIFFGESGCTIHAVKPDVCRAWPFFRGNLLDEQSWRMAQEYCPGINPDIEHAGFVKQGLAYLKKHKLKKQFSPDLANALRVDEE